jgi:hypothetical protein
MMDLVKISLSHVWTTTVAIISLCEFYVCDTVCTPISWDETWQFHELEPIGEILPPWKFGLSSYAMTKMAVKNRGHREALPVP